MHALDRRVGLHQEIILAHGTVYANDSIRMCREDRDTSEWLKTELKAKLLAHSEPITLGSADGVFRFTSVDTCDGTASVVYVRQKVSWPCTVSVDGARLRRFHTRCWKTKLLKDAYATFACHDGACVSAMAAQAKPGFELKVKIGFAVTSADAKTLATGTVAGEELCDYDGYEFDLTSSATAHADGGLAASAVRPAGATAKAALTACLKECVSRMGVPTA